MNLFGLVLLFTAEVDKLLRWKGVKGSHIDPSSSGELCDRCSGQIAEAGPHRGAESEQSRRMGGPGSSRQ